MLFKKIDTSHLFTLYCFWKKKEFICTLYRFMLSRIPAGRANECCDCWVKFKTEKRSFHCSRIQFVLEKNKVIDPIKMANQLMINWNWLKTPSDFWIFSACMTLTLHDLTVLINDRFLIELEFVHMNRTKFSKQFYVWKI